DGDFDRELLAAAAHASQLGALADHLVLAGPEVTLEANHELGEHAAERFLARIAEGALGRRIPFHDAAARVHRDDAIERGTQDRVFARLLARQRLRALAHPQLELLVRLPQLLRA